MWFCCFCSIKLAFLLIFLFLFVHLFLFKCFFHSFLLCTTHKCKTFTPEYILNYTTLYWNNILLLNFSTDPFEDWWKTEAFAQFFVPTAHLKSIKLREDHHQQFLSEQENKWSMVCLSDVNRCISVSLIVYHATELFKWDALMLSYVIYAQLMNMLSF